MHPDWLRSLPPDPPELIFTANRQEPSRGLFFVGILNQQEGLRMADVTKGTNFFIVPEVDRQSATKAEAQIQSLVQKAAAAVEQGNDKVLANLNNLR